MNACLHGFFFIHSPKAISSFFCAKINPIQLVPSMVRNDQPSFFGSPAFWNFVADQQADPVVRRLQEQVGSELQSQPLEPLDGSSTFQAA
jgi:hypothetical protein